MVKGLELVESFARLSQHVPRLRYCNFNYINRLSDVFLFETRELDFDKLGITTNNKII